MIKILNLNKWYNKRSSNAIHAINNTSLEFEDKGLVALLGNSGCGKTTLLNSIGGLDNPDSGEIYIDGRKISPRRSGAKDALRNLYIGYIFQNYNLIDDETVFNNVSIVLKMMGFSNAEEIERRVLFILDKLGILKYKNRPVATLSGGERQRVGIARAIVKNPKVIIADEPTGNLDRRNTIEIMNIIKSISREKLVILVTHEKEIAKFYADRIVSLADGTVISDEVNTNAEGLDFQSEHKIFLKDLPSCTTVEKDKLKVNIYSDNDSEIDVKIAIKEGKIYVQAGPNIIKGPSSVELINKHYEKLTKQDVLSYNFDNTLLDNSKSKLKYKSIYPLRKLLFSGIRKIIKYPKLKKLSLLGFIVASMFIFYSVSNYKALTTIHDSDFINTSKDYLYAKVGKLDKEKYDKVVKKAKTPYIIPGNRNITMQLDVNDFLQTAPLSTVQLVGVPGFDSLLKKSDIILGSKPKSDNEIVIDKLLIDRLISKEPNVLVLNIKTPKDFIGRQLSVKNLKSFKIVGIADKGSPVIYMNPDIIKAVISNSSEQDKKDNQSIEILSYENMEHKDGITITDGRLPVNDYEAILDNSKKYEYSIGSTLETGIDNIKLKVVGFYNDPYRRTPVLVNSNTHFYIKLPSLDGITLADKDKAALSKRLNAAGISYEDPYDVARDKYIKKMNSSFIYSIGLSALILVISLIEMYLLLRASFLSRIKEVGIMRAIGLKKIDVYKMFSGEIISLTIVTAVPGIAFIGYILYKLSKIPSMEHYFSTEPSVFIVSAIIILLFNLIIGLIPVMNVMRKSPAQILSRNDVN